MDQAGGSETKRWSDFCIENDRDGSLRVIFKLHNPEKMYGVQLPLFWPLFGRAKGEFTVATEDAYTMEQLETRVSSRERLDWDTSMSRQALSALKNTLKASPNPS